MKIEPLPLPGVFLLIPEPIADERGFFARSFSRDALREIGLDTDFPEWSTSFNRRRGTLRGLHLQAAPKAETKLVRCVQGAIFDVAVDLRPESSTLGQNVSVELSAENRRILYIPKGFAHGFQTLTDNTELHYHISESYSPAHACGVRWNDPDIGIAWPKAAERIMSDRDANLPLLADFNAPTI